LSVRAAYTHTTSETEEDLAVPGFFKSPNVFGDTASLVVTHDWRSRLATAVELFHASESYTALSAGGRARAYRFPGFTTLGLTSSYRLTRAGQLPVRAYVRLDNLFGEEYFVGGWRQPGRTGSAGVSLGF
jgi:hypothetical protein